MSETNSFDFSKRVFTLAVVFVIGLFGFWGFRIYEIWQGVEGNYPHELSVEGVGTAYVVPDTAKISLGVNTEAQTSEEAVSENSEKMSAIMDELEALDISKEDIKTTSYSLNPNYEWSQEEGSYQDGYRLSQNVEVKLKDFEKLNDVVARATSAGANVVGGVQFVVDDLEVVKAEAREEAIKVAEAKAEQIAEVSGLSLGKLINYYEYTPYEYGYGKGGYAESAVMMDADMSETPSISIEPGEQEVELTVTLTYRLK